MNPYVVQAREFLESSSYEVLDQLKVDSIWNEVRGRFFDGPPIAPKYVVEEVRTHSWSEDQFMQWLFGLSPLLGQDVHVFWMDWRCGLKMKYNDFAKKRKDPHCALWCSYTSDFFVCDVSFKYVLYFNHEEFCKWCVFPELVK